MVIVVKVFVPGIISYISVIKVIVRKCVSLNSNIIIQFEITTIVIILLVI